MKLLRIHIDARRGEPARDLDFGRERGGDPFVAIGGPEGSGKTSVLEAIALHKEHIAPYGASATWRSFLGREEMRRFEIESEWLLEQDEQQETGSEQERLVGRSVFEGQAEQIHADPALVHVLARYHHRPGIAKVELVGEARLSRQRRPIPGDPHVWQHRYRLSLGTEKLGGLPKLLAAATPGQRTEVAQLTEALCPRLRLQDDGATFETPHGKRQLSTLSLSQRLCFELAASFVLVGLKRSVVLIDGPEQGLPTGAALRVIGALRDYAPQAQLIAATNDPGLLTIPGGKTLYLETPR